ncbi:hypothetical protein KKB43_03995 [Patescibacteria group bacterium]|nr:hypothetical protein [Patescibacteria group bacterium]MBU4338935.1 hypothetical protein [Patescibacteria group bacterium]MBU4580151.1 hypothetical protein [Patescibacteria group bacterium]
MGSKIPAQILETELSNQIEKAEMILDKPPGKVRNIYRIDYCDDKLLMAVMPRLSSDDFVLPCIANIIDEVRNATSVFAFTQILKGLPNHLIAHGSQIDKYLPIDLRGNAKLQSVAMVVKKLTISDIEWIWRGWLAGSGERVYAKTGEICGIKLRPGLFPGAKLERPILTPTSKAQEGHDLHLTYQDVIAKYGKGYELLSGKAYQRLVDHCANVEIIAADSKWEISTDLILADEISPDSCRFWYMEDWLKAIGNKQAPQGRDKQPVRDYAATIKTPFTDSEGETIVGLGNLDPANLKHVAFVHGITVPTKVVRDTKARYLDFFNRFTGMPLKEFQRDAMGINI